MNLVSRKSAQVFLRGDAKGAGWKGKYLFPFKVIQIHELSKSSNQKNVLCCKCKESFVIKHRKMTSCRSREGSFVSVSHKKKPVVCEEQMTHTKEKEKKSQSHTLPANLCTFPLPALHPNP